jgi:hypothetical protein
MLALIEFSEIIRYDTLGTGSSANSAKERGEGWGPWCAKSARHFAALHTADYYYPFLPNKLLIVELNSKCRSI